MSVTKGIDYNQWWKKVDSLDSKGLPQSALKVVEEIYAHAKNENVPAQFVKAVIYKLKLGSAIKEEGHVYKLGQLMDEAEKASFPMKPVLHSMLADLYFQYYQNNRYRFQDRSHTVDFDPKDIRTWDLKRLVEQTIAQHKAALQHPEKLKEVKIDIYDAILYKGYEGRTFRPTLYDFLAHRAIDFFMTAEPDITRPAEQFILNDERYLLPAKEFSEISIKSVDSLSYKFYAISLLQDMIRLHLNDTNQASLVDVDIKRLNFVFQNSANPLKENFYLSVLGKMEQQYLSLPVSTEISYQIANLFFNKSKKYNPRVSEDFKWDAKKALELCQAAIARFPNSTGASDCNSIISNIRIKNFNLTLEDVSLRDKPSKTLVAYSNIDKIYFRAIKTSLQEFRQVLKEADQYYEKHKAYKDRNEVIIDFYRKKIALHAYSVTLPDDGDYQQHFAEAKIPSLPKGEYMIMAGSSEKLIYEEQAVSFALISVSNISFIHRNLPNSDMEFYILNRETGTSLEGASAKLSYEKYDYKKNHYINVDGGTFIADKSGYFLVKATEDYRNFKLDIKYKEDTYSTDDDSYRRHGAFYQNQKYNVKPELFNRTLFFTDRAIYRPGQTIYFKGIMIQTDGLKKNTVLTNQPTYVSLYDPNGQEVSHLSLTTNEFGSFRGSFTAPSSGLNGQMSLSDSYGSVYFSVEDYKRPKFEVKFDKVKGAFRLNDSMEVKGNAKAYSGANIDNVPVKFRVVRKANFPMWWYYWKGYYPSSPDMEVCNGTIMTNEKGEFTVHFKAIPDLAVPAESKPFFTYTISADVTDMNGETRSGSTQLRIGYSALQASVTIPEMVSREETGHFEISTTNLDGQFEPAKGTVLIYKLRNPEQAYRKRYWEKPDKFTMSKAEFSAAFPLDEYADESNYFKWEKEDKVLEHTFDTGKDKNLILKNKEKWGQGKYLLEILTADKYGEQVKELHYFTLFDPKENILPYPSVDWFSMLKDVCEPGEKAVMIGGSSMDSVRVLYETEQNGKLISKKHMVFNREQKVLEENILEEHRGNVSVHYTFIKNNRIYYHNDVISVPYTNKDLDISFETFRDKLQPGEKEQWKIRIKGKKGDKVAAEMVATLYDASLDAFKTNAWTFDIYRTFSPELNWSSEAGFNDISATLYQQRWNHAYGAGYRSYDQLNWFGYYNYESSTYYLEDRDDLNPLRRNNYAVSKSMASPSEMKEESKKNGREDKKAKESDSTELSYGLAAGAAAQEPDAKKAEQELTGVQARTNFNETAFFYPNLQTDPDGSIIISFIIPEALTKWKLLGLVHTKDLKYALTQKELLTQKDLMVVPNAPRFFREGDKITFSSKVSNVSDKDLNGFCQLMLFDGLTMKPMDEVLGNNKPIQNFSTKAGQSTGLLWEIEIPKNMQAITYRVVAKAGNFTDGEEMTLPVLTNRMLVTESMPLPIRSKQTKTFTLEKLVNNNSTTLTHHQLTLEFTSQPAWYAIQSLPYLMEYPYECAEQVFSRYYANSIASFVANSDPKIKRIFDSWKNITPDALLSNLEKNQELKSLVLEETPWVRDAKGESDRKRRVAVLFDLNRMSNELGRALDKLVKMQKANGAWPWFEGMPEDRYISQHIITGMGHLDHLGIKNVHGDNKVWSMVQDGLRYLDRQIKKDYEELKRLEAQKLIKLSDNNLSGIHIQYLYARSFFKDVAIDKVNLEAANYFKGQAKKYWLSNGRYLQGMIALSLFRDGEKVVTADILKSIREFAIVNEEMGMYWKDTYGYFWYQAPIETQALMIEVFEEVANDKKAVDDLKVWLLKQKQTQDWKTTKATSEACYALLLKGTNWLASDTIAEITIGKNKIDPRKIPGQNIEAGTGYFKTSWTGSEINQEMGKVTVSKKDEGVSWGALYWQYFEQLDKITPHETPLKINKQLFLEKHTASGAVIVPVTAKSQLKPGDLIKVRIELRVDRTMEYVHMKDMRASAFEPVNVLSEYKHQDGLGYYESTRDAATNFFFGYLPKGTYVFEYPLRVTHEGDFSNGITSIQCMYAPEFTSHSEGIRVKVGK
jgi:hypothetical protein